MSLEHLLLCPANQLLDLEKALEERVISQIHEIRLVGFSHMLLLYNVPSFGMDWWWLQMLFTTRGIRGILSPVYEYWVVLPTFIWVCEQLGLDRMGGRWSRVQIIIRPPPFLLTFSEVQLSQYIVPHTAGKWLHLLSSRKSFPK